MKNIQKYMMLGALALTVGFTACNDDEEAITPTVDLSSMNFTYEAGAGEIKLKWDAPSEDAGFMYIEMRYTDPRDKKNKMISISPYSDSLVIENTRARYGNVYDFTFTPFSETKTAGKSFVLEGCKSGPAIATTTIERIPIEIKAYTTNAQDPSEGPLENMFDGNPGTFFHSSWHNPSPDHHWVTVELSEPLDRFEIVTKNRTGGNNNPKNVYLYKVESVDQPTTDVDNPFYSYVHQHRGSGQDNTQMCPAQTAPGFQPVTFLRYLAQSDTKFWHLAEFAVNKIVLHTYDPETDEEEVE